MIEGVFATLTGLFLFGTFWFWALVLFIATVIATEVHFEKGTPATLTLVATVLFFHFFSGVNIAQFIFQNLLWFLLGAVVYLLIGAVVYSPLKLGLHTKNLADKYRHEQIEFLRNHNQEDDADFKALSPELKNLWKVLVQGMDVDIDDRDGSVTFDLYRRRSTVIMWIGHWPFSLLGTLLNDPVRQAINFLYARMTKFYLAIIARNLGNTKGDILTHKEELKFREAQNSREAQNRKHW